MIFAIFILVEPERVTGRHARPMAIAALVVSAFWVCLLVGLGLVRLASLDGPARGSDGQVDSAQVTIPSKVQTHDCFDDSGLTNEACDEPTAGRITLQPCEKEHDLEVYAIGRLPDGDFPAKSTIDRAVLHQCFRRFSDFVGKPYGESKYELYYYAPSERSWALLDDRKIVCSVGDPTAKTTGTLAGAERRGPDGSA